MEKLTKLATQYGVAAIAYKYSIAASVVIGAVAFALGDGGTFTVSWVPGGE